MMLTCKECRFRYMLTCRRHAPTALWLSAGARPFQARNTAFAAAAWPEVHDDDWCGEFEASPTGDEQP